MYRNIHPHQYKFNICICTYEGYDDNDDVDNNNVIEDENNDVIVVAERWWWWFLLLHSLMKCQANIRQNIKQCHMCEC